MYVCVGGWRVVNCGLLSLRFALLYSPFKDISFVNDHRIEISKEGTKVVELRGMKSS